MKKITLLAVCGALCGYANNGLAVSAITWGAGTTFNGCYSWSCYPTVESGNWYLPSDSPTGRNCGTYAAMCVYLDGRETAVASCISCNPGYELAEGTTGITVCSESETGYEPDGHTADNRGGVGAYRYTYCRKNCNSTTCASTSWTAKGTGYESRIYRSCTATGTSGNCNSTTQYRCAAGYYGSSSNGTSGCTQCPQWTSPMNTYTNSAKTTLARGTSAAGATAITGCYVTAGTYYDATGTFKTTSNCNYAN